MKRPFTKQATTWAQQVELLAQRGMLVADEAEAAFYLQHLNYYRLGAYWLPFEENHASHRFRTGTTFEAVLNLYVFDRELRLLVLDAIERIEVSVRSAWAYHLAHRHGPHAPLDPGLAKSPERWQRNLESLKAEVRRARETFIDHLCNTYEEELPPVWAVCEVMSMGVLSRWYDNLGPKGTRSAIASGYGLDEAVLASWMRHLSLVRNTCAHHSRLWNREFTVTPSRPQRKPANLVGPWVADSRRLYNSLLILMHFLDVISPQHHWRSRLRELLARHAPPMAAMGFSENWATEPIWLDRP